MADGRPSESTVNEGSEALGFLQKIWLVEKMSQSQAIPHIPIFASVGKQILPLLSWATLGFLSHLAENPQTTYP